MAVLALTPQCPSPKLSIQVVLTRPVFLQGGYDQSRTKVLHMSMNPASAAKQRLREDQARLQEECEQLRELVRALERGGPVPADLEAAASLPSSKELTGRSLPTASVGHPVGRGLREGLGTSPSGAAGHGRKRFWQPWGNKWLNSSQPLTRIRAIFRCICIPLITSRSNALWKWGPSFMDLSTFRGVQSPGAGPRSGAHEHGLTRTLKFCTPGRQPLSPWLVTAHVGK